MKRVIAILSLILAICLTLPMAVMAEDKIYKDVGYDKWYSRAVHAMKHEGIMLGDYLGFRPDDNITRAEFVTILSRLAKADTKDYTEAAFDDAPIGAWYGKVIGWAKENDLVDGYSETHFGPDDPITREQMCVILANFVEKFTVVLPDGEEKNYADEEKISEWAKDAVAKCSKWGVVSGMENNTFCPADTATRAQIAQLVYNMLLNAENETTSIDIPDNSGTSGAPPYLTYRYYGSFEEYARYIMTVSDEEIYSDITFYERLQYSYIDPYTSDDEFRYGYFGSFARKVRKDGAILYPHVDGAPAKLNVDFVGQQISMHPALGFRRPETTYHLLDSASVSLCYLGDELCAQAKDKGASWLFRVMDENALNVHNFEEIKQTMIDKGYGSYDNMLVYEKEYTLADRKVKALVYDHSADERPIVSVIFVYDNALVNVYGLESEVEELLPKLSLAERKIVV